MQTMMLPIERQCNVLHTKFKFFLVFIYSFISFFSPRHRQNKKMMMMTLSVPFFWTFSLLSSVVYRYTVWFLYFFKSINKEFFFCFFFDWSFFLEFVMVFGRSLSKNSMNSAFSEICLVRGEIFFACDEFVEIMVNLKSFWWVLFLLSWVLFILRWVFDLNWVFILWWVLFGLWWVFPVCGEFCPALGKLIKFVVSFIQFTMKSSLISKINSHNPNIFLFYHIILDFFLHLHFPLLL